MERRVYFVACRLGVIEGRAWAREPALMPPPDPLPEYVPKPTREVAEQMAIKVQGPSIGEALQRFSALHKMSHQKTSRYLCLLDSKPL